MKKIYTLIFALLMVSLVGCNDEQMQVSQVTLDFEMVIPLDMNKDTLQLEAAATRAQIAGDPGLAEFFERPRYLYLFLAPGKPTTPAENPVYYYSIPTSQSDWRRSSDSLVFIGKFSQLVDWDPALDLEKLKGGNLRAYLVATFNQITFNPAGAAYNEYHKLTSKITTERELLDLKFYASSISGSYSQLSLRDIYTTPYNLSSGWSLMGGALEDRTNYYGTVTNIVGTGQTGIIAVKDTLYHVASKVDFQWHIDQHGQDNVMQSVVVENCPKQGYLFRPTEIVGAGTYSKVLLNDEQGEVSADDANTGHEAHYADADHTDPGNQWSGRSYTYLLQPGNLQYSITTSEGGSHSRTNTPVSNGTTNEIFAAWYKLNFRIKASN